MVSCQTCIYTPGKLPPLHSLAGKEAAHNCETSCWKIIFGKLSVAEKLYPQLLVISIVSGKLLVKAVPQSSNKVKVITYVLGPIHS